VGVPISGYRLGKEDLKMARSRVTLKEGRSFSTARRTFLLDRPVIIGNETEIAELKGNSRFEVEDLDSPGPAKQKATKPPPAKPETKPETKPEEKSAPTSGPITTSSLAKSTESTSKPAKSKPAKRSKAKSGKKKSTKKG